MPIDVDRVVGASLPAYEYTWGEEDLILYNLSVGAGVPPDDPRELSFTYEEGLQAVPTFGTIPPFSTMMSLGAVEGLDVDLTRILHGDQEVTVHRPIPSSGRVVSRGRVAQVLDKGKGALVVLEIETEDLTRGELMFTNRAGIYVRGEGGFGGESGSEPVPSMPEGDPDHVIRTVTLPQQALLYRMVSGDKNPLHADPAFASLAGFERPILHGLCTFGIAALASLRAAMDGDSQQFASFKARFSGHVFPGESLSTRIWDRGDVLMLETFVEERRERVLSNGIVRLIRP